MAVIRLASGQSHIIPRDNFLAQLQIFLSDGSSFEVEVSSTLETHRKANSNVVAMRNPRGEAEVMVMPAQRGAQFTTGSSLFATLSLIREGVEDTRLELPSFEVGGLRASTILRVIPEGEQLRIQVAETGGESSLDAGSAGVRSALRSSIDREGLPEGQRRDLTLLVDVTSSMNYSTSSECFEAMYTFAAGVLSSISGDRRVQLLTSSAGATPEVLPGAEAIQALNSREFRRREVGWGVNLDQLAPDEALVVISDDLPAEVLRFPGVVHLLSPQSPLLPQGISSTVFDTPMIRAVREHNTTILSAPTRIMYDTLTRGEK